MNTGRYYRRTRVLAMAAAVSLAMTATAQKGIEGLINAERQFAWFTASHTIKEGFLKFMDSAGVVFARGADVNALELYKKQPAAPGILSWEPTFAVVSASGDFGATSGPYEFRPKSASDSVVGRGSFSSVWRINKRGEWKNLVDLGTSYSARPANEPLKQITLSKPKTASSTTLDDILRLDKKFNAALQEKNIAAWMPYIATDTRFNLNGKTPATGMLQVADAMQSMPDKLVITTKTGELSSAGDFAYTYGTVSYGEKKNNYLRIWIYRNAQWQVVLQTIKWNGEG